MLKTLSSKESNKSIKILVVEDNYPLSLNFQEILELLGYTVIGVVDSAEAAIEKVNQLNPTLILMDILFPVGMNGIQAAEQIWNGSQIPSVYVTGYADKDTLERAIQKYPFAYILKPVTKHELDETIQAIL